MAAEFTLNELKMVNLTDGSEKQLYKISAELSEPNRFKCAFCPKLFSVHGNLKEHILRRHSSDRPFRCEVCDHGCKTRGDLLKHCNIHPALCQFNCELCTSSFYTANQLRRHKLSHSEDDVMDRTCPSCGKELKSKQSYDLHIQLHSQNTYTCPVCMSTLRTKRAYDIHVKKHENEQKHMCLMCAKGFRSTKLLSQHLGEHKKRKDLILGRRI